MPSGVDVSAGPVPDHLDGATHAGPVHAAAPGRYLLRLPTVGRFLVAAVEGGIQVTVQPAPSATTADVACFLAGPIRQACWLLRGAFALRGCGVVIDGRAVAITGVTAAGKSAVTAALAQRGHGLLADGALPLRLGGDLDGGVGPIAGSADHDVQLWPDIVTRLGLDAAAGEMIRPGLAKRRYRFGAAAATPLAAIVALHRGMDVGAPVAERSRGLAAVGPIANCTAMRPLVVPFGQAAGHFGWATRLALRVPVVHLRVDRLDRDLPAVADAVEAVAASAGIRTGPR